MLKSNILNNLKTRGFINDCTDLMGLDNLLCTSKVTCYIGYDATASSLHVGHLMNIMMLRWFQKDGHRVITLLGGGTTKIGDPSFRKTERPLINDQIINGSLDRLVPPSDIKNLSDRLKLQKGIKVSHKEVEGADHFFTNFEEEMTKAVNEYLATRSDL